MQPSGRDPADDAARTDGRPADAATQDGTAVTTGLGAPGHPHYAQPRYDEAARRAEHGPSQNGQPPDQAQYGQAQYGQAQYGQDQYGQPRYGQPENGRFQSGQPDQLQYGDAHGQPQFEQPYGQPPYGQPAYANPYGDPQSGYPASGQGQPGDRLRPTRRELVTAAVVVVAMAAAGLAAGALWAWLAPRLEFRVVRPGLALPVIPEAEEYIAADGRFALLTLGVGALAGLLCWWSRRTRGPVLLLALALGGLAGSLVAWRFGLLLGPGYAQADLQVVDRVVRQPLALGARAALVVEPIAAVVVYLFAAGFSSRTDLGRPEDATGPEPDRELSSGSG